eukprot:CAMPEP_0198109616 /NCGR_PEP_ID=MMETSP1442-20131203/1680_1 /TAXON_ID= /ORGANISM="Craspedostauros australis, Strain CCMP3328" /LENGTH=670 /DNA_ID=CAMNT_0043765359 /DNA_START=19 /DNA_END=2032 /DNA_ORIENTATION=-
MSWNGSMQNLRLGTEDSQDSDTAIAAIASAASASDGDGDDSQVGANSQAALSSIASNEGRLSLSQDGQQPINAAVATTATSPDDDDDSRWHRHEGKRKPAEDSSNISTPESDDIDDDDDDDQEDMEEYLLGTLIVRVVAARGLENPKNNEAPRGLFGVASRFGGNSNQNAINPYASVKFGNSTQRTSMVFNSTDPTWPRHESMFLDVSLPANHLMHNPPKDITTEMTTTTTTVTTTMATSDSMATLDSSRSGSQYEYKKPNSVLTVAIFTGSVDGETKTNKEDKMGWSKQSASGDSDDTFLGMASIDVVHLLTGVSATIDSWVSLTGVASNRARVRITCEYESNEANLRRGDLCRFTQFCRPDDLFPLVPHQQYQVSEVMADHVQLSYKTPEGWICSFQTHRHMLVCEVQASSAAEICQEELSSIQERLSNSIVASSLTETIDRVPVDGLLSISSEVVQGSLSIFERWFNGGIDTAVSDIVHATNWDGRNNPSASFSLDIPTHDSPHSNSGSSNNNNNNNSSSSTGQQHSQAIQEVQEEVSTLLDLQSTMALDLDGNDRTEALPGMPPCPITGEPMVEPVVAPDGHTYEEVAIRRWLTTSDKSPLTGSVLAHNNLVPNYGLISSVESSIRQQADTVDGEVAGTTCNSPHAYCHPMYYALLRYDLLEIAMN